MKVLTLWQPWADLIAIGAKTIETRGWSTNHRGPIAIHAAKRKPPLVTFVGDFHVAQGATWLHGRDHDARMAFGAIVATANLVDVLPIHVQGCRCEHAAGLYVLRWWSIFGEGLGLFDAPSGVGATHPEWTPDRLDLLDVRHPRQQAPYGDYRCGRFAWLLDDVERLAEPVPFTGGQGLTREWSA